MSAILWMVVGAVVVVLVPKAFALVKTLIAKVRAKTGV